MTPYKFDKLFVKQYFNTTIINLQLTINEQKEFSMQLHFVKGDKYEQSND